MKSIAPKSIARALGLNTTALSGKILTWMVWKLACLKSCNEILKKNYHKKKFDFVRGLLHSYGIRFSISEGDLKKIPKQGPFVVIANHPLGMIDGLLLLHMIGEVRPDFKIFGNFILHQIEPLKSMIFPVNPFSKKGSFSSGKTAILQAPSHLRSGACLGVFPSGEVANKKDAVKKMPFDRDWNPKIIGLLCRENVPLLPVYFNAKNSRLFYTLSKIHPLLQTLRLPAEALSQYKRKIHVRIENPIRPSDMRSYSSDRELSDFVRAKTMVMSKSLSPKKMDLRNILPSITKPKPIVQPTDPTLICHEIEEIRKKNLRLLQQRGFEVFFASAAVIPKILHEIGRLREISFREIGEGTHQEIDLDRYDDFYHHLILWDNLKKKIAGAYRIGFGGEIIAKQGIEGTVYRQPFPHRHCIAFIVGTDHRDGKGFYHQSISKSSPFLAPTLERHHTCDH